jgi:hypothetical protein
MGLSKSKNSKTKVEEKSSPDKSDSSGKDVNEKTEDEVDGKVTIGNYHINCYIILKLRS